jgi:hypothetical protein
MRKIVLSTVIAAFAALSFAAPSHAGYYSYDYQPVCHIKKIKTWDHYGNLVIKKVKVCK